MIGKDRGDVAPAVDGPPVNGLSAEGSAVAGTPAGMPPAPSRPATLPGVRERRVRPSQLALAVALIVVGALGTTTLVAAASADGEYLALGRDVDFGARLTEDDLVTVRVADAPGIEPIAAADLDRVVGAYAAMRLARGTLLTPAQVTTEPVPAVGENVVGITLRGDRLPATRPRPGDAVLLVATPERHSGEVDLAASPTTWPATVTAVAGSGSSGFLGGGGSDTVTLDVALPAADGPTVATLAAADRIVVVLGAA